MSMTKRICGRFCKTICVALRRAGGLLSQASRPGYGQAREIARGSPLRPKPQKAMKRKIYSSTDEIVADVPDDARIMFGGFGGAGFPNNLIQALVRKGVRNITAISNNCGTRDGELGLMFKNNQINHVIASFPGPHANYFQERFAAREVTLELVPQGILCERMLEGKRCILEMPIHADFAFIKAQTADELGNLTYRLAARNFNPIMAMAAETTIAEVEEIVPMGSIEPEHVMTPAIFVHRIVQAKGLHYAG